jgi:steroid 5-alpha reductase family enzyme
VFNVAHYLLTLIPMSIMAILAWTLSLKHNNVTLVDTLWALFFLFSTLFSFVAYADPSPRAWLTLSLVAIWACRLSGHLHNRNHNKPEDARYQAIRARNQPNFRIKSLYLVFLLQAVLAWIIATPLHAATVSTNELNAWDALGIALWLIGMFFQVLGDSQLARFVAQAGNKGKVLSSGVWRYTRHPNYFGEACIWFGYGCLGLASGAWWTLISSIFMTYLLVKVTGAKLLEADIAKRRPGYSTYMQTTSGFVPWFPKKGD